MLRRPPRSTRTDTLYPYPTLFRSLSSGTAPANEPTHFAVLGGISFAHMLNDMIQSLILAIYPILKNDFQLSFAQVGLITLTFQLTASLLQPLVGMVTDRRPMPYSLPEIGRAHVRTPVTNAHLVCRLLLEKQTQKRTR